MRIKSTQYKVYIKYAALALLAALFLATNGTRSLVKNFLQYRKLEKRKAALELEKIELGQNFKEINQPGKIEQTARKELGLARPDELEYRFPPPVEAKELK